MKTETKIKPGPLPLKVLDFGADGLAVITAQGNHYATTFDPVAARLIASGPDLLAAAKSLIKEYPCAASSSWLALRDAMAKAEGFE